MKSSFKLAVSYLISQKSQSISLITSISLAVMLIFTLNVIPETQSQINIKEAYKNFSDYHVEYANLSDDTLNKLKGDKEVKEIHDVIKLGNIVDKNGVSIDLNSSSKEFIDSYGYEMIKGTYPKNENELVLEEKALKEMNLDSKLNQEIDFNVIKKYIDDKNENQIYSKVKKFKLVGIIHKPDGYYEGNEYYKVKGFTHISENQDIIPNELLSHSGVLKFNTKTPSMSKANKFIGKYQLNDRDFMLNVQLNSAIEDYDMSKNTKFSRNNKLIPMISAGLVIYNIFNIILIDMTNQIGILRSIGMRKKNIRLMIWIQSLLVLLIGLIIGFGVGYVLSLLGINSTYENYQSLYISKESIIEPFILALVTVLVSSIFSVYKASKVYPIEAIRSTNNNHKIQKEKVYHKLIRKIFGLTGEMAYKNVWRNKSRTILSILSISLAGTLFISKMVVYNEDEDSSSITSMSVSSMGETDVILRHNRNNTNELYSNYNQKYIDEISRIDNMKEVTPSINISGYLKTDINSITDDVKPQVVGKGNQSNLEMDMGIKGYSKDFIKSLDKYIEDGSNIYYKDMDSKNNVSDNENYPEVLVSNYFYSPYKGSNDAQVLKEIKVGDIIEIKVPVNNNGNLEYKNVEVRVSGLLNKDYVVSQDGGMDSLFQVILNESDFKAITNIENYNKISIKLNDKNDEVSSGQLDEIVKNNGFKEVESKYKYQNYFNKQSEKNKKEVLVSVILTLIISSINIICIIKTNIMLRIKEISTLRAIGMSMKNIKGMIIKESIIYALFSILMSSVVATLDYFKYVNMVNSTTAQVLVIGNKMAYSIPINEIVQFGVVTIVMCLLATYLSKNKLVKLSIVEGLRIKD